MSRILISCGGTGGHLAPGIAVAQNLIAEGHECMLLTSKKLIDGKLCEKYPEIEISSTPGVGLKRSPFGIILFFIQLFLGVFICFYRFYKFKPNLVISFGGYTSLSSVMVAKLLGVVIFLHEANRVPGKAIRVLGKYANKVYLPEGVFCKRIATRKIFTCGYPVRNEIKRIAKVNSRRTLGLSEENKILLVVGGSQGAQSLNNWVLQNFEKFTDLGVDVCCLTGLLNETRGKKTHTNQSGKTHSCHLIPFSDQMSLYLCAADVIVSRAGAGSIAEIVECEVPSILVPYKFAADNHQLMNARFLERQGGTVVVEQDNLDQLFDEVCELLFNDWLQEKFIKKCGWIKKRNDCSQMYLDIERILLNSNKDKLGLSR
tara:strand:- start:638 stop:1756 length:1119 start_codon:yes stop_codon:yes gene_type:complete